MKLRMKKLDFLSNYIKTIENKQKNRAYIYYNSNNVFLFFRQTQQMKSKSDVQREVTKKARVPAALGVSFGAVIGQVLCPIVGAVIGAVVGHVFLSEEQKTRSAAPGKKFDDVTDK